MNGANHNPTVGVGLPNDVAGIAAQQMAVHKVAIPRSLGQHSLKFTLQFARHFHHGGKNRW